MIKWLRDMSSFIIRVIFVLGVILWTIAGAFFGAVRFGVLGLVLGLLIGFVLGMIIGISWCGLFATIIEIAENTDANLVLLENLNNKDSIDNKELMRKLSSISDSLEQLKNFQTNTQSTSVKGSTYRGESKVQADSNSVKKSSDSEYELQERNGRTFAYKDGKLHCPKCHSFVDSELATSCSNCGKSFLE